MQQPELAPLAAPVPAAAVRRQPIIQLRMDKVAEELRQQKAAQQQQAGAGARAPAGATPESLLRCFSFCRSFRLKRTNIVPASPEEAARGSIII